MKYVVVMHERTGLVDVMLFADTFVHSDMAKGAGKGWLPRSAGEVVLAPEAPYGIRTEGKSESLKMKPHKQDAMLLALRLAGSTVAMVDIK